MKFLLLTHGSRGDVEPFVALANELRRSGHEVTIGAPREYRSIIEPNCTSAILFPDRLHAIADDPIVREGVNSKFSRLGGKKSLILRFRLTQKAAKGIIEDIEAAIEPNVDVLLYHGLIPVRHIAERLEIPAIPVGLAPGYLCTASFPYIELPFHVPPALNRLSYLWKYAYQEVAFFNQGRTLVRHLIRACLKRQIDYRRSRSGVISDGLQCFSSHVWPSKFSSNKDNVVTTGYWFLSDGSDWRPSQELVEFINAGSTPVYIGFGSLASNAERVSKTIVDALGIADVRAVVGEGWEGLRIGGNANIYSIKEAPFEWLFPKMAGIVHHGGIGTIGAALRAGRPQAIFPAQRSTRAYARRVHACGVGCFPRDYSRLNAIHLARAIRSLITNQEMIDRAQLVGKKVRLEDGTRKAVKILEGINN